MTELQKSMLELVVEIEEICHRNNITYYLAGGSVLGAVRHGGFIPWDDDIDICMTRENFNRFYEAAQKEMAPNREIITTENTPCHTKVTIKYMNKSSSQFFRSQVLDNTGCGISLDIFVLDPLPKDEKQRAEHISEYVAYNELLTPFFMVFPGFYKHTQTYYKYLKLIKKQGRQAVMKQLYNKLFVAEPKESEEYLYRWGQMHLIYKKELFGNPRYLEFEGYKLPVPEKTVEFLRATYGDTWKYLPPLAQRETHVSNVSSTISYNNWLCDIRQFQKPKKILRDFKIRKYFNIKKAPLEHELLQNELKNTALSFGFLFEKSPEFSFDSLSLLSEGELLTKLQGYLSCQLEGKFFKNNVFFEIPDKTLALVINALLNSGAFVKAQKLLKLRLARENVPKEIEALVKKLEQIQYFVRYFEYRLYNEIETDSLEVYSNKLKAALEQNPLQPDLARCYLQLLIETENYNEKEANTAIAVFKNDSEIAYYAAVIFEKAGNLEKANELYEKANETSNGLILNSLKEKGKRI